MDGWGMLRRDGLVDPTRVLFEGTAVDVVTDSSFISAAAAPLSLRGAPSFDVGVRVPTFLKSRALPTAIGQSCPGPTGDCLSLQ